MVDQVEDTWNDDAWLETRYRARDAYRSRDAVDEDAQSQHPAVPVDEELPGSVYYIPHRDWKNVHTRQPKDRPGVCVACDVAARWTAAEPACPPLPYRHEQSQPLSSMLPALLF